MVVSIEMLGHGNYLLVISSFLMVSLSSGWFLRELTLHPRVGKA